MVTMNAKEQLLLDVVTRIRSGLLTQDQGQQLLSCSERTIRRYLAQYRGQGALFVKHGNFKRKPHNAFGSEFEKLIGELLRKKYFDFNILHAREFLEKYDGIKVSRETLRRICHKLKCVKQKHKRRPKARHKRDRMRSEGLMLQMDGSHHKWFGSIETCLIATIDDATGNIPYAEFFHSEDTINCMKVIQRIVESFGIPHVLYVDRAGIFGGQKRVLFSQFTRACEELGINVIYANSPPAKGKIEILFGTLQDRLVAELRHHGITQMTTANQYFMRNFLPTYRRQFTVQAEIKVPQYRRLPEGINLKEIFCLKDFRQVKNDHTINYNGKLYKVIWPEKFSISRQNIEIRIYQDHSTQAYFGGRPVELQELKKEVKNPFSPDDNKDKIAV